jgi:GTP cyclohydrolase III
MSFRIQVALRTVVIDIDKQQDILRRFMEGKDEGIAQQRKVDRILKGILTDIAKHSEVALKVGVGKDVIKKLWEENLRIAKAALDALDGSMRQ